MKVEVRIHRGRPGLEELAELWEGLVDGMKHRHFIHSIEWHRSFLEWQEPDPDAVFFGAVFIEGQIQAILPLRPVVQRSVGLAGRGLELPSNAHVPFADIIAADPVRLREAMPDVLSELSAQLERPWDFISLKRVLGDSCAMRAIHSVPGVRHRCPASGRVDYLRLRPYDELFGALSSRFRNNLRRAHKRADALGDITYHAATRGPEVETLFEEFLRVEASGWKGREGTASAIAVDASLSGFYTALMQEFAEQEACQIHVVHHAGEPIAASFSLVCDHTVYGLKIGFDESYSKIAPGNLLHDYIFRTCAEDPHLETFNMVSDASWHAQWRPESCELFDLAIFRRGLRGRLAFEEQAMRERIRQWRRAAYDRFSVHERGRRRWVWRSSSRG